MRIDPALIAKLDVPGPRYTSYPTVPVWTEQFTVSDHATALGRAGRERAAEPLSLYIHIPFCRELCSYCGCNVVVTRDPDRVDRYLAALDQEAELVAAALGDRRTLSRVHLGGGTPTFLDEERLAYLWKSVTARFTMAREAELAVEINPSGTTPGQLERLRSYGFNRLSIGVQDFDPQVLAAVHREQSEGVTRETMALARRLGFGSINLDLIYGLPKQTPASFADTLDRVLDLRPERMAVFSFAYVPSLRPNQRRLVQSDLPTGADKLALFELAYERFCQAGYCPIGMDHFARADDELAQASRAGTLSRDFQGYTATRAPDTIALGPSGISNLGAAYAQNVKGLGSYQEAVLAGQLPTERGLWLTPDDVRRRELITQVMCNFHVDLRAFGKPEEFARERQALAALAADGLIELAGQRLWVTELGRRFVRNVAMVFDAHLSPDARPFSRAV